MNRYTLLIGLVIIAFLVGCNSQVDGYKAASSISRDGFARDEQQMSELNGQEIKLWGFVDYSNLYGDEATKAILGDWWSGEGPEAAWQFNLKARENDEAGHSFAVYIPNDDGRDSLLRLFLENARSQKPTKVFLTGRIYTTDAPTNVTTLTGLYMELQSSDDILLEHLENDG